MRGVMGVAVIGALALSLSDSRPLAQQAPEHSGPLSAKTIHATSVSELRVWDAFVTGGSSSGNLRLRSVQRDPMVPSRTVERFEQFHQGVRIWGADVVRDSEDGVAMSIFGVLSPELAVSTTPAVSPESAREALLRLAANEPMLLGDPELVVIQLDSGDYRLSYTSVVAGDGDVVRAFIDAQTGVELMRYTEIQKQEAAVGTGTGVLGDRKKLSVEARAGTYMAFDRHRPPVIETFDMRGNLTRTKLWLVGLIAPSMNDLANDADNVWTDVSVVDAHVHVSWTYDYYFKRFGRSGFDGKDGPIDIVVNAVSQQGALSVRIDDLDFVANAFYCSPCGPYQQGVMFFGNGIPAGYTLGGQNYSYLAGAIDVVAHELTHAVTDSTSNLEYRNESGALNEAFSDMMSKSVEFFYHAPGDGVGQADYTIGKDIVRGDPGVPHGLRSMANPQLYGDPDHYSAYRRLPATDAGDWGGVHTNSGIPNHAFYLAIEGGTNRTSGLAVQGVGAANREQIEKVFFRAFTVLMPRTASFSTARAATLQAARDLYGAGSNAERAVAQAWTAVGVN